MKISYHILLIINEICCLTKNDKYSKQDVDFLLYKIYLGVADELKIMKSDNSISKGQENITKGAIKNKKGEDKNLKYSVADNNQKNKKIIEKQEAQDKSLILIDPSEKINFNKFSKLSQEDQSSFIVKKLSNKVKSKFENLNNDFKNLVNKSEKIYKEESLKFEKYKSTIKKDITKLITLASKVFSKKKSETNDTPNEPKDMKDKIEFKTSRKKWIIDPKGFREKFNFFGQQKNKSSEKNNSEKNNPPLYSPDQSITKEKKTATSIFKEKNKKITENKPLKENYDIVKGNKDIENVVHNIQSTIDTLSLAFKNFGSVDFFIKKEDNYVKRISYLEEQINILSKENEDCKNEIKKLEEQFSLVQKVFESLRDESVKYMDMYKTKLGENYNLELSNQKIIEFYLILGDCVLKLVERKLIISNTIKDSISVNKLLNNILNGFNVIISSENGNIYSPLIEGYIRRIQEISSSEAKVEEENLNELEEEETVNEILEEEFINEYEEGKKEQELKAKKNFNTMVKRKENDRTLYTIVEENELEYEE